MPFVCQYYYLVALVIFKKYFSMIIFNCLILVESILFRFNAHFHALYATHLFPFLIFRILPSLLGENIAFV
jgi:hypothetical protein